MASEPHSISTIPIHESDLTAHVAQLKQSVDTLTGRVDRHEASLARIAEVSRDVKTLIGLFQASRGVLAGLKWLVGLASAATVTWAALHGKIGL